LVLFATTTTTMNKWNGTTVLAPTIEHAMSRFCLLFWLFVCL
jgi:hypothetical protein